MPMTCMDLRSIRAIERRISPASATGTSCLVLAAVLLGCTTAPMTNTIVRQADSPNGPTSALLVERYYHAALSSNEFFLLVLPRQQDTEKAVNDKNIGDLSALVATSATKIQLRWQNNDTLLVVCEACGLEAIDISKKLDHVRSIKVIYQGFPEHTAYS